MKSSFNRLGQYIQEIDIRNKDLNVKDLIGVTISKEFIPSVANIIGTDLSNYKIISKNQFACSLMQVSRDGGIAVSLYKNNNYAIMSPAYHLFEVVNDELIPEYLEMILKWPEFDRAAVFYAVGGVRGTLTWEEFCDIRIPVPSKEKQRDLIKKYSAIENRETILENINNKICSYMQIKYDSLFKKYLTNNDEELPYGWKRGIVGDYADVKSGYAFSSSDWRSTGEKVVKISNIINNSIELKNCDCVDKNKVFGANDYLVTSGDILIAMTGATTGKIGIVPRTKEKIYVNQRVGKFYLGENPIDKAPFLYCTLLNSYVSKKLRPDGMAGSAQDNISGDDIKNIPIILPDSKTLSLFNSDCKGMISLIIDNLAELMILSDLKKEIIKTVN